MVVSAPAPGEGRKKYPHLSKQDLSACRADLLELMQSVNFGRIEHLPISNGEPIVDPRPVIVRELKFGGDNGPRPELGIGDFLLKQQAVELFAFFDELWDGVIDVLEVKHGLPFRVIVTEVSA
jgi:hypothetical protein